MNLSWTPSTDNVAVTGYEVYRGTSASTIAPYSLSPVNSFLDLQVAPSKTYYYQVDAYDAFNNHSAKSAIVSASTRTTSASATPAEIAAAVTIPANAPISLDVTGTGTTFPGADLSVMVFF